MQSSRVAAAVSVVLVTLQATAEKVERPMDQQVLYRSIRVDGLSVFYREAGRKEAPTLLLLHGLPSSSRMFEPLLARLSDSTT